MRLRYAGQQLATFMALGLELEPGAEFEASDTDARALLARGDVEEVQAPQPRRKAGKSAAPADSAGAPASVTEEV